MLYDNTIKVIEKRQSTKPYQAIDLVRKRDFVSHITFCLKSYYNIIYMKRGNRLWQVVIFMEEILLEEWTIFSINSWETWADIILKINVILSMDVK
ncbi:hypothetical protein SalAn1F4_09400 [Streptococcus alactolyticus]|nr:hypothetical protein SalAn1F4_09400 [Streptococcus alactolyticus]